MEMIGQNDDGIEGKRPFAAGLAKRGAERCDMVDQRRRSPVIQRYGEEKCPAGAKMRRYRTISAVYRESRFNRSPYGANGSARSADPLTLRNPGKLLMRGEPPGLRFAPSGLRSHGDRRITRVEAVVPIRTLKIWNQDMDASQIRTG